jgi:hypothetical protein
MLLLYFVNNEIKTTFAVQLYCKNNTAAESAAERIPTPQSVQSMLAASSVWKTNRD